jgi:uncharacterized membrane protein
MSLLVLILVTGAIFLIADAIMLPKVVKPHFERHLGDALLQKPRPVPAAMFYILYMVGVIWFAGLPALQAGEPAWALVNGAALGLVAYGTYELVSYTVMRDWHPSMVALDLTWGTALTALSVWIGTMTALAVA